MAKIKKIVRYLAIFFALLLLLMPMLIGKIIYRKVSPFIIDELKVPVEDLSYDQGWFSSIIKVKIGQHQMTAKIKHGPFLYCSVCEKKLAYLLLVKGQLSTNEQILNFDMQLSFDLSVNIKSQGEIVLQRGNQSLFMVINQSHLFLRDEKIKFTGNLPTLTYNSMVFNAIDVHAVIDKRNTQISLFIREQPRPGEHHITINRLDWRRLLLALRELKTHALLSKTRVLMLITPYLLRRPIVSVTFEQWLEAEKIDLQFTLNYNNKKQGMAFFYNPLAINMLFDFKGPVAFCQAFQQSYPPFGDYYIKAGAHCISSIEWEGNTLINKTKINAQ